jgi:hypothetical protein
MPPKKTKVSALVSEPDVKSKSSNSMFYIGIGLIIIAASIGLVVWWKSSASQSGNAGGQLGTGNQSGSQPTNQSVTQQMIRSLLNKENTLDSSANASQNVRAYTVGQNPGMGSGMNPGVMPAMPAGSEEKTTKQPRKQNFKTLNKTQLKNVIQSLKNQSGFLTVKEKEKLEDVLIIIDNFRNENDQRDYLAQIVYQMRAKMLYNEFMEKIIPLTGFTFEDPVNNPINNPLPEASTASLTINPTPSALRNVGMTRPAPSPEVSRAETMDDLRKSQPDFVGYLQMNVKCTMLREALKPNPNKDVVTACFLLMIYIGSLSMGEPLSNIIEISDDPDGKVLFKGVLLDELSRGLQNNLGQVGLSSSTLYAPLDKDTLETVIFLVAKTVPCPGTAGCGTCKLRTFPGLLKSET